MVFDGDDCELLIFRDTTEETLLNNQKHLNKLLKKLTLSVMNCMMNNIELNMQAVQLLCDKMRQKENYHLFKVAINTSKMVQL